MSATIHEPNPNPDEPVVYVVEGPQGFTETFDERTVDVLVRMGLIEHVRDGHVMVAYVGDKQVPHGPLHRFYAGPVES